MTTIDPAAPEAQEPEGLPSTLITGRRADGSMFRPSDWAERLIDALDVFEREMGRELTPWARGEWGGGAPCVRVSERLRSESPHAWSFMLGFAADNGLVARDEPWPGAPAVACEPQPARRGGPRR